MKRFFTRKAIAAIMASSLMLSVGTALSAEPEDKDIEKIRNSLVLLLPGVKPDSISKTPIPGLYEVLFGPRLLYMSADGRYLLQGDITDLETRKNITEPRVASAKLEAVNAIGEDNMISFGKDDSKYTITVFTDIDCGYCRKLHAEMDQFNENDIRVRYLFYPRAGIGSESYNKAVSVWCADDKTGAMTTAKAGGPLDDKTCNNPVKDHFMLGQVLGLEGTPAMVLDDGTVIPGYIPAPKLKVALDAREKK